MIRKDPFFVGNIIHVFNKGNRKQLIVLDDKDRWSFIQMLYYFNTQDSPDNPMQTLKKILKSDFNTKLVWPDKWPKREPLVKILAFILIDNHYHLILEEIKAGGIAKFMQKLGTGITNRFNTRYNETGKLFQGSYKARRVDNDNYLRYLAVYVMIKNAFEMYPGGIKNAMKNFDDAYDFAVKYQYSSLKSYAEEKVSPIIDIEMLKVIFPKPKDLKEFAKGCMEFVYFDEKEGFSFPG